MPTMDELLAKGAQEVRLPAPRIAEREDVLMAVDERPVAQRVELHVDLPG